MRIIKVLIVLILAAAIFGGAGYFVYEMYFKPQKLDRIEQEEIAQATPTPDPSLAEFESTMVLVREGKTDEARAKLIEFINRFPSSAKLGEAKQELGEMNAMQLLSNAPGPWKEPYTVVRGDSLVRIASKTGSNAELIFRANNLESINLQIGQQLFIPKVDTSIVISRENNALMLFNHGEFFKEYPVAAIRVPNLPAGAPLQTTVGEKLAQRGEKRIAFGANDYVGSDRVLTLASPGVLIRGVAEEALSAPDGAGLPGGILLSQPDMEEIFVLVSRGTPVTIQ